MIDPVGHETREQIEQDAGVARPRRADATTGLGERVPQLGRRRTNTDGEREMVDVVEIAGGDRGDQRGDQLVERTGIEQRAVRLPVRPRPRTPPRAARAARGRHPLIGRESGRARCGRAVRAVRAARRNGRRHLRGPRRRPPRPRRGDDPTTRFRRRSSSELTLKAKLHFKSRVCSLRACALYNRGGRGCRARKQATALLARGYVPHELTRARALVFAVAQDRYPALDGRDVALEPCTKRRASAGQVVHHLGPRQRASASKSMTLTSPSRPGASAPRSPRP